RAARRAKRSRRRGGADRGAARGARAAARPRGRARAPPRSGRRPVGRLRPPRNFARAAARARVHRRLTAGAPSILLRSSLPPGSGRRRMAVSMPMRIGVAALVAAGIAFAGRTSGDEGRQLDGKLHHLGGDVVARWQEATPEPAPLRIAFESRANATEWVLEFAQRDVGDSWVLAIDGRIVGTLPRCEDVLRTVRLLVPAGTIADGKNELTVTPVTAPPGKAPRDDILIGRFHLYERPLRELYSLGRVVVHVADAASGAPLPARVTVTNEDDQ